MRRLTQAGHQALRAQDDLEALKALQARNPRFWLLVVLKLLFTMISRIRRSRDLPVLITLALVAFSLRTS
jgi:DNA-binding response OmpR family regulator